MDNAFHEPPQELSPEVRDRHRALASLIEELEAVDWYDQRASLTSDEELKKVIIHNRNEEIEHAAMTLEWLRRSIPEFDEQLKTYMFTEGPITELEEEHEHGGDTDDAGSGGGDLGIGSLKEKKGSE